MIFFFNDTATTEIYPLSLPDALPISRATPRRWTSRTSGTSSHSRRRCGTSARGQAADAVPSFVPVRVVKAVTGPRSEEHTSELQSRQYLVCRLLLEKKKQTLTPSSHA